LVKAHVLDRPKKKERRRIPLAGLTRSLEGTWHGRCPERVHRVQIDSRNCDDGSLFFALKGEETHGHHFLNDAAENGAVGAVVEEKQDANLPQFVVPDSNRTLRDLAIEYRSLQSDLFVVGITGSCGKTTVKEMVADLLLTNYDIGKTPGNFNNKLGVPLTVLNEGGGDILVAELATNQPGEIATLTDWIQPDMGVITHVGPAHLEGLGTVKKVAEEKGSLFAGLPEHGIAVLPRWIRHHSKIADLSAVRPTTVGSSESSDYAVTWKSTGDGYSLTVDEFSFTMPVHGEHFAKDAAIASVVARELGVSASEIKDRFSEFEPLVGRGKEFKIGDTLVIDGGYNANPDSFEAALEHLEATSRPRLALLGDMKEMGTEAGRYHRELGERLNQFEDLDVIYVGEFRDEIREGFTGDSRLRTVESTDDLPTIDFSSYQSVLVKASRAVGLNEVIEEWKTET